MPALALNLLGELEVVRDGTVLPLPPSKKTRALLAYLALNPRSFRREALCELLWEIPDDPRGSLRWSLSKLRRLVDDDDRARIVADRNSVALDTDDVAIDVRTLHELAGDPAVLSCDELESTVRLYRGDFLEGLELSSFHDFHAWCIAERENAVRDQTSLLRHLVSRLTDEPERALRHARSLVQLAPYDEAARADLIRLLMQLHHTDEAEHQYHLGKRMLEEVGAEPGGALFAAWRGAQRRPRQAGTKADATTATATEAHALVGRDDEVARLARALRTVDAARNARVLLISGAAGMGKSRLLACTEALAREAGAGVLSAAAFEPEAVRPFALWSDLTRQLADGADPFAGTPGDNREQLLATLNDIVAGHMRDKALVLLLDDLQWCDESSATALHYVIRTNRQRPLLVVMAAREDEVEDNAAVQKALRGLRREGLLDDMALRALPEEAIRRIVEALAPDTPSERLAAQCAGNPLLAIELARAERAGDSGGSLKDLLRERLDRFDVDGAEMLRWASVLAPRIEQSSLMRVTGLDATDVAAALEIAERQAILVPGDRGFRFTHDLIGRSIYADIAPARRRIMHRRVAELLEDDTATDLTRAADLAHHATQSGDPALAARAMVSAGRLCLRFFANDDALALARKGMQLAAQLAPADRVRVTIEIHDILLWAAPLEDWRAAAAEYVSLAEQAIDHGALWHARLGYHMASYMRWMNGHWADAREETLQAERVTRSGSTRDHVIGMAETAKCLAMLERDLGQADSLLMEAAALARREGMSYYAVPMAAGMLHLHQNQLEDAEEHFQEARNLCKSAGDRIGEYQANEYLVMVELQRGRPEVALRYCEALLELGERLREGSEGPFAHAMHGLCRLAIDDDPGPLDGALGALRMADAKFRLAYVLTRAALLDLERGRAARAAERAREALAAAEALQRATEMLLAHLVLALAHVDGGDTRERDHHAAAVEAMHGAPAARWARQRAAESLSLAEVRAP